INGPHIGDGQQQSATDGSPISWVMGTAKVAGTVVWAGERFEVKIKDSGKGGPEVSHYESRQSFAVCICESSELRGSTMGGVLMVAQDGVIVYDVRPGSTMVEDSLKWKENIDFMFGAEDQLPHPTIEAEVGADSTPAYRGRLMMVSTDCDIYSAGDRIPNFTFLVSQDSVLKTATTGTDAWPSKRTLAAPQAGTYSLYWYTGAAPDCFEVWDGNDRLMRSGWYGSTSWQQELDNTLDAHDLPHENIIEATWPHADLPDGTWDDHFPDLWDSATFSKTSNSSTVELRVYSVSPSGWGVKMAYGMGSQSLADVVN